MIDLNNKNKIDELDSGRLVDSLAHLPDQIKSVWAEAIKIKLPLSYSKINKVVVFGMGGSNLGAAMVASIFKEDLKAPLIIEAGYEVPGFIDNNSLCILSSYSGNTEEVLLVFSALKEKKAKILAIGAETENSSLMDLARKEKFPGLFFDHSLNFSNQPRAGLGYSFFGLLAILCVAKILKINSTEIKNLIITIKKINKNFSLDKKNNPAKNLAKKLSDKGVVLAGGEFLEGNLHVLRNQFNENSKNFSAYLVLPDMNHHALEGLSFPEKIKKDLIFLVINSSLYSSRVKKRLELTKKIIKKNKITLVEYSLKSRKKLEQAVEMISFGSWLSFYLGILNGVDPSLIPWVDWFKKNMK